MRLLNTRTRQLESFLGKAPRYAILSHTWEEEEVTFEDMKPGGRARELKGYPKLKGATKLARGEGFNWIWIDACCIDKSSSAELSEAINSMFQWYKNSAICYAYLADVPGPDDPGSTKLEDSKWFTRGWTLQELIAPAEVVFFGRAWNHLGTRASLARLIYNATKIPADVLEGETAISDVSAAAKFSWASTRTTTRPEDVAYSLLGLFNVNMPLLYGEGEDKAFLRLQAEFLKFSDDETIFAWQLGDAPPTSAPYCGMLAATPKHFRQSGDFVKPRFKAHIGNHPTEVTNRGLRIELTLIPLAGDRSQSIFLAVLHCVRWSDYVGCFVAIIIQRLSEVEKQYARIAPDLLVDVTHGFFDIPINRVLPSFIDECRRSGYPLHSNTVQLRAAHTDPEGEVIFVRQTPKESGFVAGIYVYSKVQLNAPVKSQPGLVIQEQGDAWERWIDADRSKGDYYWISFQHEYEVGRLQPGEIEAPSLRHRKVVGCFHISLTLASGDRLELYEKSTYLVVGLEPLPPNPFGTPPGYTRPWYAFVTGVDGDTVMRRFAGPDSPSSLCQSLEFPNSLVLEASFSIGSRFSSITYRLDLVINKLRI